MRFIETRKSGVDKAIDVYTFTLGKTELVILRDVLGHLHNHVPKSLFTQPFMSRVEAMRQEINKTMIAHGIGKEFKRPFGWNPEAPNEVF